jgi:hypothetical protein
LVVLIPLQTLLNFRIAYSPPPLGDINGLSRAPPHCSPPRVPVLRRLLIHKLHRNVPGLVILTTCATRRSSGLALESPATSSTPPRATADGERFSLAMCQNGFPSSPTSTPTHYPPSLIAGEPDLATTTTPVPWVLDPLLHAALEPA